MFEKFGGRGGNLPPVVTNIIAINVLLYLITVVGERYGLDLTRYLALYYPGSEYFQPYQLITHMFMHSGLTHLFFNMFALWMFGRVLESVWGPKRFFIYYFVTGLGAAGLHLFVNYLSIHGMMRDAQAVISSISPDAFAVYVKDHVPEYMNRVSEFVTGWISDPSNPSYVTEATGFINQITDARINVPTVGASGAVFGVLLAFGMLFPNTQLMLLFPPIPIKAKWFVLGYGAIELWSAVLNQPGDNVAHFAHLGGMIFGFILIKYWNRTNRKHFY